MREKETLRAKSMLTICHLAYQLSVVMATSFLTHEFPVVAYPTIPKHSSKVGRKSRPTFSLTLLLPHWYTGLALQAGG